MRQAGTDYTVFDGYRHLLTGTKSEAAAAYQAALARMGTQPVLIFDNETGRSIDVDISAMISAGASEGASSTQTQEAVSPAPSRGRGRPKLGVIAREVTLLPRHWEWLAAQPGGASVALRKLVETARLQGGEREARRKAHERAYHFMLAIAGNLPGYEEATRALFADDRARLETQIAEWPVDVRRQVLALAFVSGETA